MTQITLTQYAIHELQALRSSMNNRVVPSILCDLKEGRTSGLRHIRGTRDLERHKRKLDSGAFLRLALDCSRYPDQFCVVAAGLRRKGDINDFYNQDFNELPRNPSYEWNGETGTAWDFYIAGDYKNSPVVSADQIAVARLATPQHGPWDTHRVGFHSMITQSPPGTGKTVTAADEACRMVKKGYEVIFLLPEVLIQQVVDYRCIKQAKEISHNHFFIGTFHQWIKNRFPEIPFSVLSPDEEFERLQNLANTRLHWPTRGYDPIVPRDVLLYQIYVTKENYTEGIIYTNNFNRIETLREIDPNWWSEVFTSNERCRLDYAISVFDYLQSHPPQPDCETSGTLFIVDEAQDYILDEIEIIKYICRYWQRDCKRLTSLWLLGDLNQRIIPVDFDWGALHLEGERTTDWPDYRTTERILTLANQFKKRIDSINTGIWLPRATDPKRCFQKPGDLIKIIVYPDLPTAESFLQPLIDMVSHSREQSMNDWEKKYSLLNRLASRARVFCSDEYHVKTELRDSIEFMPVFQAKGREFQSCIAFCIFDLPKKYGQLEAYTKWYTQLTRARERLLIITTQDQLESIGKELFTDANIDCTETEVGIPSVEWIEYNSDGSLGIVV